METTSTIGRPPSVESPTGTAIAKLNAAAAKVSRPGADMPEAAKAPPAKLTAVERLEKRMELDVDRPTGIVIGRLVQGETGEVVEQVPSEEAVRILEKTRRMIGAILDKMA